MESKTSQFVDDAKTDALKTGLQHTGTIEESGNTAARSQAQTEADAVSVSVAMQTDEKPEGVRYLLLLICLFLGSFSVGYDSSCIGTLTPVITDQFHSLSDLGWYQTAYLVAVCAPMLLYGQLYTLFSMKALYMTSLSIFIIGSVLTSTAPSSVSFIVGRTLSGFGAAGITSGMNIIIANTTTLEHRPTIFGICGALECAALAFGPLIGGSIGRYTTWRVSFYIIIPMAVSAVVMVFFCIGNLRQPKYAQLGTKERLQRIDWAGLMTQLPMTVCLVLSLQWAGTVYPWSNWRIILLLTITGVLVIVFFLAEHKVGDKSMVSLKILRQRTVAFASLITFCNVAALWAISFYLPLYFQTVRGASTLGSGLMYLPMALSMSIFALIGGRLTTYIGYYSPVLMIGSMLTVVGTALISTLQPDSPAGKWISYQIIYGIGIGLAFQPPFIAVQTVLEGSSIPAALVLLYYFQILGGIIVLSIAQNVFLTKLVSYLATAVPQLDTSTVQKNGALSLISSVSAGDKAKVLIAYNRALVDIFYICLGLSCVAVVCTLGIEWKRIKNENEDEEKEKENEKQIQQHDTALTS